ncbi:MAG: bifunctional hydroxymethylpyrimidine kinase/phosphomethylpyrimidine kinase [Anaplasmataceae bacterium]|nr:bifunctional hydroxymethylpyrimidine kinase/phosphomethylpyrimidine kinase [Anaplasmataceae bacterium]
MNYKCLTIGGFDSSGGAGIQADLKTFTSLGCYGMSILTALPIQNTCGVKKCYDLPLSAIEDQLHVVFSDIKPDAIKIGMLFSREIIELIVNFFKKNVKNIPIILDPVMVATSGHALLKEDAIEVLIDDLFPLADIITPNIPEAKKILSYCNGDDIINLDCIVKKLLSTGIKSVLLKGGHDIHNSVSSDIFIDKTEKITRFNAQRIKTTNTHGTGCTLSSAITSFMARGATLIKACEYAKKYITGAINSANKKNKIGGGNGPVDHCFLVDDNLIS